MAGKRRVQAPNGDVLNSAEPLSISNHDDVAAASKPKMVGRSDHIELQLEVPDAGNKLKKRAKKRKKEFLKNAKLIYLLVNDEERMKVTKPANDITMPTAEPAQPDNLVLQKLLRGPRYFDPPDESWRNCGEQGHRTADCTAEKKKKPCFLCGSTEQMFKKCKKERDCVICKTKGHNAKDCPESSNITNGSTTDKICLIYGDCGHDMFSCENSYFPIDLKAIQFYVCNGFVHLCCYTSADHVSKEFACYKCGGLGHTGLACARLAGETAGFSSPALCFNCHQGGHFAHECPNPFMGTKSSDRDASSKNQKIRSIEDDVATYGNPRKVELIAKNSLVSPMPCKKDKLSKNGGCQSESAPPEANNKNSKRHP